MLDFALGLPLLWAAENGKGLRVYVEVNGC